MEHSSKIVKEVYDHTFFPNGRYRHYLTIVELHGLLNLIIKTNETVGYLQVIPFYKTVNGQEEFENHMLYVKQLADGESAEEFYRICSVDENGNPCDGIISCYMQNDLVSFHKAIRDYIDYLPKLVSYINAFLLEKCHIAETELLFGSICFEINAD